MEQDEFVELMLQSLPEQRKGRTTRLTLVRTTGEFFVSKIHNMRYVHIRSIPVEKNYRFIISSFTHEEYQEFKNDFWNDVDFLKIPQNDFEYLPEYARSIGYEFRNFRSSGPGTINLNSPKDQNGSKKLIEYMVENKSKGFLPYHLTFSLSRNTVSIRNDFNFFLKSNNIEIIKLVYQITDFILSKNKEKFEKYASLKLGFKLNDSDFVPITTHLINLHNEQRKKDFVTLLSTKFLMGDFERNGDVESTYVFDRHRFESSVRINFISNDVILVPTIGTKLEFLLTLDEFLPTEEVVE